MHKEHVIHSDTILKIDFCVGINCADICLTRGTKRKLTQSTLLNFRFSKKISSEPTSNNLTNEVEIESVKQSGEDLSRNQEFILLDRDTESSKAGATISSSGCLNGSFHPSMTISTYVPSNAISPDVKDEHFSSSMLQTVATSCSDDACTDLDSSTTITVDTVIVGRRFHENIELTEDGGITFLRDPQNAKDSDAIKVSIFSNKKNGNTPHVMDFS
jgi:Fanconi-associated nuclease 1